MARLTWHGHSCFSLVTDDGTKLLFDPWLDGNPSADIKASDVDAVDFVLVSHGHGDHFADAISIATRTNATLISSYEIVGYAQSKGVKQGQGMSIGGGFRFPFGYLKLTPALHGTGVDTGDDPVISCMPSGFWIELNGGKRLYHAGDTALITDMQLLNGRVDVALLPIGDNFTMGPEDAARAVEFIRPRTVIPMHYNTFDVIKQDPASFSARVGGTAEVVVLEPGGSYEF
jgi:L-ascorbate metabolism protein UlaG (beta-lactamase superfamily)